MVGLVIALLIAGFVFAVKNATIESSILSALSFLWVWNWTILSVTGIIFLIVIMATLKRSSGLSLLLTPIFAIVLIIVGGLFLGGIYLMSTAGNSTLPFSEWDLTKFGFGFGLYGTGILVQFYNKMKNEKQNPKIF